MRLDRIITQLDQVITRLDKIQSTQHTLYLTIQQANRQATIMFNQICGP